MKVLIIGSTSFVGKALGESLLSKGHYVKFAGRSSSDISIDLTTDDYVSIINESFDAVVLAAADFGGNTAEDIVRAEMVNAIGVIRACKLCELVNAKHLLVLSTVFSHFHKEHGYYNTYSISKRHGEELAAYYCKNTNLNLTIVRPSMIFDSKGEARKHQAFLYTILDKVIAGEDITIYGARAPLRNYIHIDDLVETLKIVVENKIFGEFDCVSPHTFSMTEIIELAFSVWGKKSKVVFLPEMSDLPDLDFAFDQDLASQTNYIPKVGFEEAFVRYKKYLERIE